MANIIRVKDLADGVKFEGYLLVRSTAAKTANNGSSYLDMVLTDRTGEISAKIWDYKPEQHAFKTGSIIKVRGAGQDYMGKLQLKVELIRQAKEQDDVDISELTPAAPETPEDMYEELMACADSMTDEALSNICKHMLESVKPQLMYYPAAVQNHHSIRGGLLYHTLTMLRAAEALLQVYDWLNADLVYAGVILHDLAKTDELNADISGLAGEYSPDGQLLGHITRGILNIEKAGEATGADAETVRLLQHMVLSHHYEPEFGSPRRPMFAEAELLHYLDILDARLYDFRSNLMGVETGKFSDRVWTLDKRQLYKHHLNTEE